MQRIISDKLEKEVLKKEKSETQNITPQPVRRNKKFTKHPSTSVLVDEYHWVPHLSSTRMEEIILIGSNKGHSSNRLLLFHSRLFNLAAVTSEFKEIIEELKIVDVKGKKAHVF